MSEVRNLILAVVLSALIMFGWKFFSDRFMDGGAQVELSESIAESHVEPPATYKTRAEVLQLSSGRRVELSNGNLHTSIDLQGAKFDDLALIKYHETVDGNSPEVVLLSPQESEGSYFAEFGWVSQGDPIVLPGKDTLWHARSLSPSQVVLTWGNSAGVVFKITATLDDHYMFRIDQEVLNETGEALHLAPYGRINRVHDNSLRTYWISHEGAVGAFSGKLEEWTYKDLASSQNIKLTSEGGQGGSWIGWTDKYWFTALIPQGGDKINFRVSHSGQGDSTRYQIDYSRPYIEVPAHSRQIITSHLFAGAKELSLLDEYRKSFNIALFDKAVDFGVLYFITKPVFMLLQYFNSIFGNLGVAIVFLTLSVRMLMFPLSNKSYVSMFKLRVLQPEILRLKELYKNDAARLNKEISSLFKKNNANPMSGFLPVLIQIPFFFALYKVLFVTIEMRHAPFFLWIKDLSTPDPANVLTLFGLLDYNALICIGVLPILLGLTMVLQQKISGPPVAGGDQVSLSVMKFLPYIFVFVFASFPAGLIIYWICGNLITLLQQMLVKRFLVKSPGFASSSAVANGGAQNG